MSLLDAARYRLRTLVGGARHDREVEDEMRFHLELEAMHVAHTAHAPLATRAGAANADAEAAARAAARRRFGNLTLRREEIRAMHTIVWLDTLTQDVRYAARTLARAPLFVAAAVVTLALGIGATTAIFSFTTGITRHAFAFLPDADRLVWVVQRSAQCPTCNNAGPGNFLTLAQRTRTLRDVAAVNGWGATLGGGDGAELTSGFLVTPNLFRTLGVRMAVGRGFRADDAVPGRNRVLVLSHDLWTRKYGADPHITDSTLVVNGEPYAVVGVLPAGVFFPRHGDVYAPLVLAGSAAVDYSSRYLDVFGRLAPGATVPAARRELDGISRTLAAEHPATNAGWFLVPRPLREYHTDDVKMIVPIFFAAVAVVLLIACASVANLTLARAVARSREIAVRTALGAGRLRIMRQLLVEALVVALAGGALGVGLAYLAVRAIHGSIPASLTEFVPGWDAMDIDRSVLLFALVISCGSGVVVALLPALRASRAALTDALKEGERGSSSAAGRSRARSALVVGEVMLAVVLVSGAALLVQSFVHLGRGDPGIRTDHVLTMHLVLPDADSASQVREFYTALERRLDATPGVRGAGVVSTLPMSNNDRGTSFDIAGRPPFDRAQAPRARDQRVSPGYFDAMGIRLLRGRFLTAHDDSAAPRAAVVNETFASRFWPGHDPVGEGIVIDSVAWQVVGVIADVHHHGLAEPTGLEIDRTEQQTPEWQADLAVRTVGDPERLAPAVREVIASIDPRVGTARVMTMDALAARYYSPNRLVAGLLTAFAVVALVIAAVGLYGVIAYGVTQRTREIGVRIALGASSGDIVRHVGAQALRLTAGGVVLGVIGALAFARLLGIFLYGVGSSDPLTLAGAVVGLFVVGAAAALVPARRAARLSPVVALRRE